MERQTFFADILLPLPLAANFTYRIPSKMVDEIAIGKRVVVQFGQRKIYAGLVVKIHQIIPQFNQIKYILNVLDAEPIVNSNQFKFWEWIAQYYLSYQGEVMNAALPSALKMASESKIVLHPSFNLDYESLSEREFLVVQALELNQILSLTEVGKIVELQTIMPLIKTMIEKSIILPEEEIQNKFKPKTEDYIRLTEPYLQELQLESLSKMLEQRASKQLELLLVYIQYSNYFNKEPMPVSKTLLLKKSGVSNAVLNAMLNKGIFEVYEQNASRLMHRKSTKLVSDLELSEKQNIAFNEIQTIFNSKDYCLLHGITGSGKTEIYIKLIDQVIKTGKQALLLVPEIALTAQIINRLQSYFGDKLGFYHSKYGSNERVEVWHKVLDNSNNAYQVIIGARSAIFLPFRNLGLIIVDEEHDSSYKQFDPSPRYSARDAALFLTKLHGAKCLLGSATPSIETYYQAINGKYGLINLNERFSKVELPLIHIVDTVEASKRKQMKSHFSTLLLEKMKIALDQKEQIILFQNRRGFSLRIICEACGWTPSCNNCDVSLTFHKNLGKLKCHYCGATKEVPELCPECGRKKLIMKGFGTEKLEEEIPFFFPEAIVKRMDLDTMRSKNSHLQLINDFEDRKIDILVGTQMVTKGLDFDFVSLVGVMNADNLLFYPDFRSFERSFQQITQVSGRSGRKNKQGNVIIQTSQPNHAVLRNVLDNDYIKMFESQIEERKNFRYPPFYRLIRISLKHKESQLLNEGANVFADLLRPELGSRVLGPEFPLIGRIKNLYIKDVLIKFEVKASHLAVKKMIREAVDRFFKIKIYRSILFSLDVDPY